jgi:hypothetical protein
MKKFEQALLAAEQQNKLKRVRLKLDPKIREAQDYSQYDGYEGYVLSETETHVEIQIKDQRIILPRVVLENKLLDFIKGAAPKTFKSGKKIYDNLADAKKYYTDPNVSGAEKVGRVAGGLTNAALKAANPMTYLRGIERIATAPTRLLGRAIGINDDEKEENKRDDFGDQNTFVYTQDSVAQNFGSLIIQAANMYNPGHTIRLPAGNGMTYYTIENKNNPNASKEYVVIEARINRQPIGRMPTFTNVLRTNIDALRKPPLSGSRAPTIDSAFFDALKGVAEELKKEVAIVSKDTKNEISTKLLYIPSLTEFEIKGYLTNKLPDDNFVVSEKYT